MDIRQVYSPSGAVRVEQRFPRFAGFRIAKQPTFPRNKFGMSETSCWIGLFSKFVKFHLVKSGNRQGITHSHNVVQGANLSLIKRSKMRQKESTARMRRRFSALSIGKALDNIDLNLVSHRYVSGVLKDDHFVSSRSLAPRFWSIAARIISAIKRSIYRPFQFILLKSCSIRNGF